MPFCWESLAAWGEADAAGNDNYFATRVFRNPIEMPRWPMLCHLSVLALAPDGQVVAENFVQHLCTENYPAAREELAQTLVLRGHPADWSSGNWNAGIFSREFSRATDFCYGGGLGFFEWTLPLDGADIRNARRLRVLCETSSCRPDHPQTDVHRHPTTLKVSLNQIRVYEAVVPDHPHDSRGALSYLRGGFGAYGYLIHSLSKVSCCATSSNAPTTFCGSDSGRRPMGDCPAVSPSMAPNADGIRSVPQW